MALYYYYAMFALSLVILVLYIFLFHKHFDASITIMAVLIPVVNLAAVIMAGSHNIDEALVGLKLSYIGGCFILLAAMFLIFNICDVKVPSWLRAVLVLARMWLSTMRVRARPKLTTSTWMSVRPWSASAR